MERPAHPFPLAAKSSHHSHYHRFLLGADPDILAPFPKPYCVGELAPSLRGLTEGLDLQRWRKLYHASFPWVAGFEPSHYRLGNVPAHRPLPREYGRPARRFAAFDFVQVADASVSALALVAGDRRIVQHFARLADDFCAELQKGAAARAPGPSGSRRTARMLAGQFAEPNNRWLMPFLHVHARVLNFTSFPETPGKLDCVDTASLARSGHQAKQRWVAKQADLLTVLGYRAAVIGEDAPELRVDGVCPRLIAAIEAPRIAVLRMLERALVGDRPPSVGRLAAELPPTVIAAMAEQLESLVARSLSWYKPPKVDLPSEGPWRAAVREHLGHLCPGSLVRLDRAALHAKASPLDSMIFPTPQLDPAHRHAPSIESLEAPRQLPTDPELGSEALAESGLVPYPWLARDFETTLGEVNERIVGVGPDDPLVALRQTLPRIDHLGEGADPDQLRQSRLLLGVELERREQEAAGVASLSAGADGRGPRPALSSLEELFEHAALPRLACEQELGGRSL